MASFNQAFRWGFSSLRLGVINFGNCTIMMNQYVDVQGYEMGEGTNGKVKTAEERLEQTLRSFWKHYTANMSGRE